MKLAPVSPAAESEAAFAFAMAGDTERAESLAQDLGKRFPLDTQMQSLWLPAIQAQVALDKKNPALALNALQASSAIELDRFPSTSVCRVCIRYMCVGKRIWPLDREALQQGSSRRLSITAALCGIAGREHWRIWEWRERTHCKPHGQGAEADAARVRALAAYKDFLALWKDADADVPVLKEAKAEYAKLQ